MSKLYWGRLYAECSEFPGCWLHAKVRPGPWWFLCRVKLFLLLVWRPLDEQVRSKLPWRAAWDISRVAVGIPPCTVRHGPLGVLPTANITELPKAGKAEKA